MQRTCRTVLIVEDEPTIRLFETMAVEEAGYRAMEASDADTALVLLESEASPDIMVTDVQMPGSIDGLELARTVRERWPQTGVVIASTQVTHTTDPHVQVVRKPFSSEELICAMASVGSAA